MGPIEYIEFPYDENEKCENFAWIVFKFSSSVEDSIKLLRGTKLYGLEILTKNYSEHQKDPMFHDQLNYFKQLVDVERNSQSNNGNRSRWNDPRSDNTNYVPDSLPEPPIHGKYNSNNDKYSDHCETISRHRYEDNSSKYQHSNSSTKYHNPVYRNEHHIIDKPHYSYGYYRKSDYNNHSDSPVSSNNQNYDCKNQQDYNSRTSFNWKESKSTKDVPPVRDLRDTIHRKRFLDTDNYNDTNTNTACTSQLDLRDTMYHNKNDRYKDSRSSYQSDSKARWSEKKSVYGRGSFSDKPYRKDNYTSECYNKSNTKHQNHYTRREYQNQSFNQDKTYDSFHDHDNEYTNNFDDYNGEKNRPNNKQTRQENMEFSSRQYNSYHPYKRNNDGHEEKEYKNSYNERSGYGHNRSNNRGDSDRSKHYYYS